MPISRLLHPGRPPDPPHQTDRRCRAAAALAALRHDVLNERAALDPARASAQGEPADRALLDPQRAPVLRAAALRPASMRDHLSARPTWLSHSPATFRTRLTPSSLRSSTIGPCGKSATTPSTRRHNGQRRRSRSATTLSTGMQGWQRWCGRRPSISGPRTRSEPQTSRIKRLRRFDTRRHRLGVITVSLSSDSGARCVCAFADGPCAGLRSQFGGLSRRRAGEWRRSPSGGWRTLTLPLTRRTN